MSSLLGKSLVAYFESVECGQRRAEDGMPEQAFRAALMLLPMINVDLLINRKSGETLLAWRSDEFGRGWHIPGGIIRYRETAASRIAKVAETEIGAPIATESMPCHITQFTDTPRGHFISLLYRGKLLQTIDPSRLQTVETEEPLPGQLNWFRSPPSVIYPSHERYASLIGTATSTRMTVSSQL